MKLARFNAILDAYGATPERWPEHERAEALIFARSSVMAARALANARRLDTALQAATFPDLASQPTRFTVLHARIVGAARPRGKSWIARWFGVDPTPSQLWPSLAGLAVASLLGFGIGLAGLTAADPDREVYDLPALSGTYLLADGQ